MAALRNAWLARSWLGAWLRGVRGRLLATYLLAAIVLAVVGVAVFTTTLRNGLHANVDAGLHARADAIAADIAAGNIERSDLRPPTRHVARAREAFQNFYAVIDPSGRVIDAQPNRLPASPVTTQPRPGLATTLFAGSTFRILTEPVQRADGKWLVVAGQSLDAANDADAQVRRDLIFAVPILLVLAGAGAWLLSGAALRPVDRMRADAQALSEHTSTGRITEPPTRDSLNQLARTFNTLLDRLHGSLDQQRGLVADAGHELRTPLAVLQTELETAVRPNRTRDDLVDSINHAQIEVARLAALADDLLLLAQADGAKPITRRELTDVGDILDDLTGAYAERAEQSGVALALTRDNALLAEVDPIAIRRVLDNLMTNALRHTPRGGAIRVAARAVDGSAPSRTRDLVLEVRDTGPGFPPEFLPHAFDRFTRSDQARSRTTPSAGSGLGLAIVATLVHAHHGTVTAANTPAGGAAVEIRIPGGPGQAA